MHPERGEGGGGDTRGGGGGGGGENSLPLGARRSVRGGGGGGHERGGGGEGASKFSPSPGKKERKCVWLVTYRMSSKTRIKDRQGEGLLGCASLFPLGDSPGGKRWKETRHLKYPKKHKAGTVESEWGIRV